MTTIHEVFKTAEDMYEVLGQIRYSSGGCWVWMGPNQNSTPYFVYKGVELNPQVIVNCMIYDREYESVKAIVSHCITNGCCNPTHTEVQGRKIQLDFGRTSTIKLTPFEQQHIIQDYASGRYTMRALQVKYGINSGGYISDLVHGKKNSKYRITSEFAMASGVPMGNDVHERHL